MLALLSLRKRGLDLTGVSQLLVDAYLWGANSQYDGIRLCRAALHRVAVRILFAHALGSRTCPSVKLLLVRLAAHDQEFPRSTP